jgi:hypothetical protein
MDIITQGKPHYHHYSSQQAIIITDCAERYEIIELLHFNIDTTHPFYQLLRLIHVPVVLQILGLRNFATMKHVNLCLFST